MIDLKNIERVYFIGIGGIGMSAIAKYFKARGVQVSGYDKTETVLTKQLENEGMKIHYNDNIDLLDKKAQLVIYTPAVPKDLTELEYYRQNNYNIAKRSDVLGQITNSSYNICVAGTHGKTTISTIIAHILRDSGFGCNAFLGGISVNYNTNFWSSEKDVCVIEADEYDRSFLKLRPDVAIISAMDADHLDIYGTKEAMQDAFIAFSKKVKPGGLLISKYGLPKSKELSKALLSKKASNHVRYTLQNSSADASAVNIKIMNGGYTFDVRQKDWMLENVVLNMGGMHNVENAVAAIVVAHHLEIENEKIKSALKNFRGIKRRFEYVIPPSPPENARKAPVFIDDYAHHPEELKALITGAKNLFSARKCTIIFQPHLYTRTRDLAHAFAESLDLADEVILLPIYPARELPIEGVTSKVILDKMENQNKQILSKEEVLKWVEITFHSGKNGMGLFITAGAGDIDQLVQPLKEILM